MRRVREAVAGNAAGGHSYARRHPVLAAVLAEVEDVFVAAVVDSLAHDQSLAAVEETRSLPPGAERVHTLVASDRQLVDDRDGFRDFFAIFPHVVLDEDLRERVAALYEWYRDLYAAGMSDTADAAADARLRLFASLMVAMTDGLAVQKLLDPDGVDLEALFALWDEILQREFSGEAR